MAGATRRGFLGLSSGLVIAAQTGSLADLLAQDEGFKWETRMKVGANEKRFKLLLLPEGFTEKQRKVFDKHVETVIKAFGNYKALKEIAPLLQIDVGFVHSAVEWKPTAKGLETAFGITYDAAKKIPVLPSHTQRSEYAYAAKADLPCIIINNSDRGWSDLSGVMSGPLPELFMHELGHGCHLGDESYESDMRGINISYDEKNLKWQALLDRKTKGIGLFKVKGTNSLYRGEEGDCLMHTVKPGLDFGLLCTGGIITYARSKVPVIAKAPDEAPLPKEIKSKEQFGIELLANASATSVPVVQAWYQSGKQRDMDVLAMDLREKPKLAEEMFKADAWTQAEVKLENGVYRVTTAPSPGCHVVAVVARDPNPLVLLDPDNAMIDDRVYRVDVAE
jgi:hypothetical protein